MNKEHLARSFANLMFQGKTKAALRLLGEQSNGGVLHLDDLIDTGNRQTKERTSLLMNTLLVNVHFLKQSSTITPIWYILFCLNLWLLP